MQMSASEELEQMAVKYANEAIRFDKEGARNNAISRYDRAIEILLKLCALYPEAPQNKLYAQHVETFKKRVQELKEGRSEPASDQLSSKPVKLDQMY